MKSFNFIMGYSPEVTQLRKAGKISEVFQLALERYNITKDKSSKIDLGWVYYDLLKKAKKEKNTLQVTKYLKEYDKLDIPVNEEKIHKCINRLRIYENGLAFIIDEAKQASKQGNHKEALRLFRKAYEDFPNEKDVINGLGWEIVKELKISVDEYNSNKLNKIRLLLNEFLGLNVEKPSELYSAILRQVVKISKKYNKFPYFVKEWDLSNLYRNELDF